MEEVKVIKDIIKDELAKIKKLDVVYELNGKVTIMQKTIDELNERVTKMQKIIDGGLSDAFIARWNMINLPKEIREEDTIILLGVDPIRNGIIQESINPDVMKEINRLQRNKPVYMHIASAIRLDPDTVPDSTPKCIPYDWTNDDYDLDKLFHVVPNNKPHKHLTNQ
jgi:hypothetical protein